MSNVVIVNESNYEQEVLKSELPVIIDYWAPWCGPCKAVAPAFASLAEELDGKVKFVKIDVDQSPSLTAAAGIRGVPSFRIFNNGEQVGTGKAGAQTKQALSQYIADSLA